MISILKVLNETNGYYQPGTKIPLPPRPGSQQPNDAGMHPVQAVPPVSHGAAPIKPPILATTDAPKPAAHALDTIAKPAGVPTFIKPPANLSTAEHGNAIVQKGIKTGASVASDAASAATHAADAHPGIAAGIIGAAGALGINKLINRNKPNQ
jgi:hypothetical protein